MEICDDFLNNMIQNTDSFRQRILKIAIVEYVNVFEQLYHLSLRLLNVDGLRLVLLPFSLLCLLPVKESQLL